VSAIRDLEYIGISPVTAGAACPHKTCVPDKDVRAIVVRHRWWSRNDGRGIYEVVDEFDFSTDASVNRDRPSGLGTRGCEDSP
jgi:hypothetical protein